MATPAVPRPRPSIRPKERTTDPTDATDNRGTSGTGGDKPPRGRRRTASTAQAEAPAPPRTRAPRAGNLESRLTEFLGMASIPFALQGDMYCAHILATRTPALAKNLAALADENPGIKRVLNKMMEGSAWGGVALSVVAIAVPIAQHHQLLPGGDPFAAQYPPLPEGIGPGPRVHEAPAAGFGGWSQPVTEDTSSMGAPAPGGAPAPAAYSGGNEGSPDLDMTRVPGAPPGVVTVAATSAGHAGAR